MTTTATHPSNGAMTAPPFSRLVAAKDLVLDHEHWNNPRTTTGLDDGSIEEFAADIKLRGVQVPLIVQRVQVSETRVIDLVLEGQRRTLAAIRVNPKMLLPVIDRTPEPIELDWETSDKILLDMLAVATHREGLSDFELSEVAERMKNRGKQLAEIGLAIGRSTSWCSRILRARGSATPKLLVDWKKGNVTTEQFKEIANVKEPAKQEETVKAVVAENKAGNKSEARALAKEAASEAKGNGKSKVLPVVKGPQLELKTEPKPAKKPGPSRHALEELVRMTDKRPPVHDLVKGIAMGVKYALGEMEPDEFGKAWLSYLTRVGGETAKKLLPDKPAKKKTPKKARPAARKAVKKSKR